MAQSPVNPSNIIYWNSIWKSNVLILENALETASDIIVVVVVVLLLLLLLIIIIVTIITISLLELELENSSFDTYKYTSYTTRNMWSKKLHKYSRETKAKVHTYRYRQSHSVVYAVTHELI